MQDGTALFFRRHEGHMLHSKTRKKPGNTPHTDVRTEMAKPRMARSARIAELKMDTARIPDEPSATVPGTVRKIIPPTQSDRSGKAQIKVDVTDRGYRDLRIENSLTDEHGDDVKLKKGAHVEVTVTKDRSK
jgi:hypothetical protein